MLDLPHKMSLGYERNESVFSNPLLSLQLQTSQSVETIAL